MTAVDALPDDKLTGFALRLVLTGKLSIPSEGEVDPLVEAEAAFIPAKTKKAARSKASETPSVEAEKPRSKKATGKKQVAA